MVRWTWQGLFWLLSLSWLCAEGGGPEVRGYTAVTLKQSWFGEVAMLPQEREEYATTLTRIALGQLEVGKFDAQSLRQARRLVGLALHLAPRNREALVANHQMARGVMPQVKAPDYKAAVFTKLLFSRGRLLKESERASDIALGRCFIELAAEMDVRNEDVVYEYELQKMDGGPFEWDDLLAGENAPRDAVVSANPQ